MRKTLLASAALFGMALAVPALAEDTTPPPAAAPAPMTGQQMPAGGMSHAGQMPMRAARQAPASNIGPADTHGKLAHALPGNGLDPNAGPVAYLQAAQQDLRQHRGGAAQEAMERAETRLLDRSVPLGQGNAPDQAPAVQEITQALDALGHRDWRMAQQHLDAALQHAQMAETEGGGMQQRQSANMPHVPGGAGGAAMRQSMPGHMNSAAPMTMGNPPMPFHNVMPPNGGVETPNGGVMSPAPND